MLQWQTQPIVVPIFFYKYNNEVFSKCIRPKFETLRSDDACPGDFVLYIPNNIKFTDAYLIDVPVSEFGLLSSEIKTSRGEAFMDKCRHHIHSFGRGEPTKTYQVPNPWRARAGGKIIRHVPISLYSDDTSGNKSKRWNKHVSYCFTLSGLPPNLSNQEYNVHFISTSNRAGPLELAEPIVEELNELATKGSVAYDISLDQEVLFMTVPLCFLADSPMAAEITNTPNPGSSNNPCRICKLKCPQGAERSTMSYMQDFFGCPDLPEKRIWSETVEHTKDLWVTSQSSTQKEYERKQQLYGIKDRINSQLIELKHTSIEERQRIISIQRDTPLRIYNPCCFLIGFDGCLDTPVEILHVILLGVVKYLWKDFMGSLNEEQLNELEGRWAAFSTEGLSVPPIQPRYMIAHYKSLIGKEYRVILQAAPFVLFHLMTIEEIELWTALCHIGSMAFQTHIEDMEEFIAKLEHWIQVFLFHIAKMNGRWVNKPKFHHLRHLSQSIRRYGPAGLFATEKFESYNGVVRNSSIHSNRQSPGRDIATSFNNYHIMRWLSSGTKLYDHETRRYFQASPDIINIFKHNLNIQQSMGYNPPTLASGHQKPTIHGHRGKPTPYEDIPPILKRHFPAYAIQKISAMKVNQKDVIRPGTFVLEASPHTPQGIIGYVESIWEVARGQYHVHINRCQKNGVLHLNGMTILVKTFTYGYVPAQSIICSLNVQHNCFESLCSVGRRTMPLTGRQEGNTISHHIQHRDTNSYLLNKFSHHAPINHQNHSDMKIIPIPADMMQAAMEQGLYVWEREKNTNNQDATMQTTTMPPQ
ncbi:hypothetical protein PGTUg99_028932 [Puccinia graminis f. sp. tritici]|uniref:Uncharacterized protein n=1 Tax=Puccinia graminis f. sp. tritici TaxID=56615 RepID=A0A5B0RF88_PUCGR|nr:hypothetical protein PGTUg99_028932 [Puccinia graminis f. sp. tritici]